MKATEKQKQRMRSYYLRNKEKILLRHKKNYDPEKKKAYNKYYFAKNKEKIREKNAEYYRREGVYERIRKNRAEYQKFNREKYNSYGARYRKTYREKILAHRKLNLAIYSGKIKRGNCSVCGKENAQGHHYDYNKPLDVIWLCPQHHSDEHSKIKKGAIKE